MALKTSLVFELTITSEGTCNDIVIEEEATLEVGDCGELSEVLFAN